MDGDAEEAVVAGGGAVEGCVCVFDQEARRDR